MKKVDWFSIKRSIKHWYQRRTRGWDDSDTWSLDNTLAKMIHPRLKRFRELTVTFPCCLANDFEFDGPDDGYDKWLEILDEMIYAFNLIANRWHNSEYDEILFKGDSLEYDRVIQGLEYFKKYYLALWW